MFSLKTAIRKITSIKPKAIPAGLVFGFHFKIKVLLFLVLLTSACGQEVTTVQVGLETRLIADPAKVIAFSDTLLQFYEDVLLLEDLSHFPGKICVVFDTVYSSTVSWESPVTLGQVLPENAELLSRYERSENQDCLFFSSNGYFVYRTLVPEKKFNQSIVLDIAKKDSALVFRYFDSEKVKDLIIR